MTKIKNVGKGFVEVDGKLYNLTQFKEINKYDFGYDEDPDGLIFHGIKVTPLNPTEENVANGVDGTFLITTYGQNEENEMEADYETIKSALGEE